MTREKALELHEKLKRLLAQDPGADDMGKRRLIEIRFPFDQSQLASPYLQEKVVETVSMLEPWLSQRKWQKYGSDPTILRMYISNALAKMRAAIDQVFPKC